MTNILARSRSRSSQIPPSLMPTPLWSSTPLILSQSRILCPHPSLCLSIKEEVHHSILELGTCSLSFIGWRFLFPSRIFMAWIVGSLHMGHPSCCPSSPCHLPCSPPMPLSAPLLSLLIVQYHLSLGLSQSMNQTWTLLLLLSGLKGTRSWHLPPIIGIRRITLIPMAQMPGMKMRVFPKGAC